MERADIVAAARSWIGTPYVHQQSLKGAGCDCLGLIRGVWRDVVGDEPERPPAYSPDWAEANGCETLLAAAARHLKPVPFDQGWAPGDVLMFRWRPNLPVKHCAIASTFVSVIHAYQGHAVQEDPLPRAWYRQLAAIFKFPGVR